MQYQSKSEALALAKSLKKNLAGHAPDLQLGHVLDALAKTRGLSSWNALTHSQTEQAIDDLLAPHEKAHVWNAQEADLRAEETGEGGYGPEAVVRAHTGFQLRSPAYPDECSYLRVCDPLGREVAYWTADEWREAPEEVLGAIVGALVRSQSFSEKAKPPAKQEPTIAQVDFNRVGEVIFAGRGYTLAWREAEVLANLSAVEVDEDMVEDIALTLHAEEDGLVFSEDLTLQDLRDMRWSSTVRGFVMPDGTEFRPFYVLDFADLIGA